MPDEQPSYRQRLSDAIVSLGKTVDQAEALIGKFEETVKLSDDLRTPVDSLAKTLVESEELGITPPTDEKSDDGDYPKNLYQ